MPTVQKIAPCLWFDDQTEEAADFYVAVFKKAKKATITKVAPGRIYEISGRHG